MSYCRFLEADVYIFLSSMGLECCGCFLNTKSVTFSSTQDMVNHLQEHIAAGHYVPDNVIPALWADDAENFPGSKTTDSKV